MTSNLSTERLTDGVDAAMVHHLGETAVARDLFAWYAEAVNSDAQLADMDERIQARFRRAARVAYLLVDNTPMLEIRRRVVDKVLNDGPGKWGAEALTHEDIVANTIDAFVEIAGEAR